MKKWAYTRRHITLVEMMIVMFLIAMITGVIAVNYTGSLEEGKAFKTKAGIEKIQTVLDLHLASKPEDRDQISTRWREYILESPLVKNYNESIKDGWGVEFEVSMDNENVIHVISKRYDDYQREKKGSLFASKKS